MKKQIILSLALALAGCGHYEWQQQGATIADLGAAKFECQQKATEAAPAFVVPTYNRAYDPKLARQYRDHCRNYEMPVWGECREQPQQRVTLTDMNSSNRRDLFNACMNAKGWSFGEVKP